MYYTNRSNILRGKSTSIHDEGVMAVKMNNAKQHGVTTWTTAFLNSPISWNMQFQID
jgi:hypothetical protein